VIGGLASSAMASVGDNTVAQSVLNVKVYIIAVDGVGGHVVGNLNHSVEGALDASSVDTVDLREPAIAPWPQHYSQPANITRAVITDWDQYKNIVETASNIVIINAHADVIPVPSNYSKETWVAKIAEAVAYRNVTWVHTGGYPFYHYQLQNGNESLWGEDGFKQFMNFMGIANVRCIQYGNGAPFPISSVTFCGVGITWPNVWAVYYAEEGYSINASGFQDKLLWAIWGDKSVPLGAVIKFKGNGTVTSGLYVHVGALRTSDAYHNVTDGDYYRSYVGTAAALYEIAFDFASRQKGSASGRSNNGTEQALLLTGAVVLTAVSIGLVWRRRRGVTR